MKRLFTLLLLTNLGMLFAQTNFLALCREGSLNEINQAIVAGQDVNVTDEYGQTPLMYAATANTDPQVITILMSAGADINARSGAGWTALMYAARDNTNPAVLQAILEAGAEVGFKNDENQMAFNYSGGNPALANSVAFRQLQERSLLFLQHEFAQQILTKLGAEAVECPQEVLANMPGIPVCAYVSDDEAMFKSLWKNTVSVVSSENTAIEVTAVNDWSLSNNILLRAYMVAGQRLGVVYNGGAIIMLLQFP